MEGAEVGPAVLLAVVGGDRATGVQPVRELVQPDHQSLAGCRVDLLDAEALVQWHPGHDRRMVAVPLDRGLPFHQQPALGVS